MPSKSKIKGNGFEREIVKIFNDNGIKAVRAYGSDGRSLGLTEDVDILIREFTKDIKDYKIQAKRRAALPRYLRQRSSIDFNTINGSFSDGHS